MKTILVSNGPVVKSREAGDLIESFDTIVRFNNFETRGYEKYVGKRTDIWATRICESIQRRNSRNFPRIIGVVNWCIYTDAINNLVPRFLAQYPQTELILAEQSRSYSERFGYNKNKNWLSVGMITLMHLIEEEGISPVYVYGFAGDTTTHYFPKNPRDPQFHNWETERKYLGQLIDQGKVVCV